MQNLKLRAKESSSSQTSINTISITMTNSHYSSTFSIDLSARISYNIILLDNLLSLEDVEP